MKSSLLFLVLIFPFNLMADSEDRLGSILQPTLAGVSLESLLEIPHIEPEKAQPVGQCTYECSIQLSNLDLRDENYRQADVLWVQVQTSQNDRCNCPTAEDVQGSHRCPVKRNLKTAEVVLPCR